jgi:hypothetical protein
VEEEIVVQKFIVVFQTYCFMTLVRKFRINSRG